MGRVGCVVVIAEVVDVADVAAAPQAVAAPLPVALRTVRSPVGTP